VHHPDRLAVPILELVRGVGAGAGLSRDADRHAQGHQLVAFGCLGQELAHRAAGDVLHGDEEVLLLLAQLVDLHHVGVGQRRDQARLLQEHLDQLGLGREVGEDALDHHHALEATHAALAREEDLGHAAIGEPIEDLVAAEPLR
jgi:hypothetical protein